MERNPEPELLSRFHGHWPDSPFFIYDALAVAGKIAAFRGAFGPEARLRFSVKSNPNPGLLRWLAPRIDGFDVSSETELRLLRGLGFGDAPVSVSGPGKTDACLRAAAGFADVVVHVDSEDELAAMPPGVPVSLRIFSDDAFSAKLGFTREAYERALSAPPAPSAAPRPAFRGLHVYLGREGFSFARLQRAVDEMGALLRAAPGKFRPAPVLAIGPGLPARWDRWDGNRPPPFRLPGPCEFEIGRGLVGEAGMYATPVLARKSTDAGDDVVIVNGGLQHLGSPFVTAAQKLGDVRAWLFRGGERVRESGEKTFVVTGSLCLGHDILHPRLSLPESVRRDDWLVFPCAGAYGPTAGVPHFIGQDPAREFLAEGDRTEDVTVQDFRLYHECF